MSVCDTGEGVRPELIPHLFTRGVSEGGTGFGLSICKTMMEAHHGDISLESDWGEWTRVTFTLPIDQNAIKEGLEDGQARLPAAD